MTKNVIPAGTKIKFENKSYITKRDIPRNFEDMCIEILGGTIMNVSSDSITIEEEDVAPSVYHKRFKGHWIDVYVVLRLFKVESHEVGHAIKKLLMPGQRHGKDEIKDLKEAVLSIQRRIAYLEGTE